MKFRSRFWFTLGILFILMDPLLAHLSDAEVIHWPARWNMSVVSPFISKVTIGGGILFLIIAYFKAQSEGKSKSAK